MEAALACLCDRCLRFLYSHRGGRLDRVRNAVDDVATVVDPWKSVIPQLSRDTAQLPLMNDRLDRHTARIDSHSNTLYE